jgi:hypothetical protein
VPWLITVHEVRIHVGRVEGEVQLVCVPSSLVRIVSEEQLHHWALGVSSRIEARGD